MHETEKQMTKTVQIDERTWIFEEDGVRFFLLTGTKKALLIDSGMQTHNAKELAEGLTDLPISLLCTHTDLDHTGSNGEFEEFFLHPSECAYFYGQQSQHGRTVPVWDGDILDLGGRALRVIAMPGHTPGSIAVLDEANRRLFSGDPVQDGRIFMFGEGREMHAYLQSLKRLEAFSGRFDEIYPSHGSCPVTPGIIPKLIEAAGCILSGNAHGKRETVFGRPVIAYEMDVATFLCDAEGS